MKLGRQYGFSTMITAQVEAGSPVLNEFQLYTGTSSVAVMVTASNGSQIYADTVAGKQVGYTPSEAKQKSLTMSYRVTNSMMQALLLNDMHGNLGNLLKVQQQMSTQRKYNAASDNPNAVTKGMGLETMIFEGGQYRSNLQDANSWLKFTDDALGHIDNTFQRIRELAI